MVRMHMEDIAVSGESNQFLLLLRSDNDELLPIVIDAMQALAIAAGRGGEKPERPLTHDLMLSLLEVLDAEVSQVEITDLAEGTFYAMVVVERGGVRFDLDARPSDALALAVRTESPIYVAEHVLEFSGLSDETDGGGAFEA